MPKFAAILQIMFTLSTLGFCWYFLRSMSNMRRENADLRVKMYAATYFANILAERGVGMICDDCGNMLSITDEIDILQMEDGRTYVGHRTHGRGFDEKIKRGIA